MDNPNLPWLLTWLVLTFGALIVFTVIFPRFWDALAAASRAAPGPEMTAWEALAHIRDNAGQGGGGPGSVGGGRPTLSEAAAAFARAAREGRLTVSGQAHGESAYADIPPRFWETNGLDAQAYAEPGARDPWHGGKTAPAQGAAAGAGAKPGDGVTPGDGAQPGDGAGEPLVYVGLRVPRDQVARAWPPAAGSDREGA